MKEILEAPRKTPVRAEVDILIVGGGPAGIMAAEAAAKGGYKVMLIDSRTFLGSNMTIGLPLLGFLGRKGNVITKGLPLKFVERLQAIGQATGHRHCPLHVSLTMVGTEASKELCMQILEENNVETLLHVFCCDAIMDGDEIKGVIIESKAGREAILAKVVVDCTGDGDVAARAGAVVEVGNEEGRMQPPTIMFSMRGIDMRKFRDAIADNPDEYDVDIIPNEFFRKDENCTFVGMRKQLKKAKEEDGLKINVDRTIIMTGIEPDEMWVNMSRVNGVDTIDPASETYGTFEATKQNAEVVKYLNKYVPGFENAWVDKTAQYLGARETRRIMGEYVLTREDILECRRFDDAICAASYPIDLHHPVGGDCTLEWCPDCYDIPYRCLVPKKIDNLLLAGRCISTTHIAMASTRVMGICMATGEAAGKAALVSLQTGAKPRDLDVKELQRQLKEEGVYFRP